MNRKHGIPTTTDGKKFTLSRSSFLDGSVKTFFGPGQPPLAVRDYQNPTDWPAAGTLLRVPQVVWITSLIPAVRGVYSDAERFRIDEFLPNVKSRIEAMRPNRTWVSAPPWFTADGADHFIGDTGNLPCIPAPQTDLPFFGTDFFHIYLGWLVVDFFFQESGLWGRADLSDGFMPTGLDWATSDSEQTEDPAVLLATDFYQGAKSFMSAAYDKFSGFSAVLLPSGTDQPSSGTNEAIARQEAFGAAVAADMTDLGFSVGPSTTTVTEDSLVGMIADHFGFDPDTGLDVG